MATTEGNLPSSSNAEAVLKLPSNAAPAARRQSPTEPSGAYIRGQASRRATTLSASSPPRSPYEALGSPERPARIRHCPPHHGSPSQHPQQQQRPFPASEPSDMSDLRQPPSPESDAGDTPKLSDLARLRLAELKLKRVIFQHERYLVHREYDEPESHRGKKVEVDAMLTRAGRHAGTSYRRTGWDHEWDNMVAGAARVLVGEPFEKSPEEREGRRKIPRTPGLRTGECVDERKKREQGFEILE